MPITYTPRKAPLAPSELASLAELLVDAVRTGAAVSFMQPLDHASALSWWSTAARDLHPRGSIILAQQDSPPAMLGCVMLQPAWAPNQPHRAEICKLIVHSSARGQGLAKGLMNAAEALARHQAFTLLTLDCRKGAPAESLYRKLNWIEVGQIPNFALNADHSGLHDDVIFYKSLS
jgi:acetyltransferase